MLSAAGVSTFGVLSQLPFWVEGSEEAAGCLMFCLEVPHAQNKRHDMNISGSAFFKKLHFMKFSS